jgi:hypothetical protein
MKRRSKFGTVIGLIAALAGVPVMASDLTVGQFLVQVAKARNVDAVDGESAVRGLQASGVNLSGLEMNKPLTEGDVARIASAVGVKVTTSRPAAPFSQRQADGFVRTLGADLSKGGKPDAPSTQGTTKPDPQPGKGKSKGHVGSPSKPH